MKRRFGPLPAVLYPAAPSHHLFILLYLSPSLNWDHHFLRAALRSPLYLSLSTWDSEPLYARFDLASFSLNAG